MEYPQDEAARQARRARIFGDGEATARRQLRDLSLVDARELSDWEREFLPALEKWIAAGQALTSKQQSALAGVYHRHFR